MKQFPALLLAFGLLLHGCANGPKQPTDATPAAEPSTTRQFDLQGHRGARGLFPENSLEGFVAAVDLQVNTIELDVVITKDGQVVVSHEPWMSPTICLGADGKPIPEEKVLNIFQMTYAEVTNYDCGSLPHPDFPLKARFSTFKPLLSEVISEVEARVAEMELDPVNYNIEIKSTVEGDDVFHPIPKVFCELVLDVVQKGKIAERTIIQSFDVRALQEMKQLDPSIPVALLLAETDGFEKELARLGFTPEIYSPNFRLVNEGMVRSCHQNGIKIIPWTVNEEEDMVELLDMGVDGIITDYPDVALTLKL